MTKQSDAVREKIAKQILLARVAEARVNLRAEVFKEVKDMTDAEIKTMDEAMQRFGI